MFTAPTIFVIALSAIILLLLLKRLLRTSPRTSGPLGAATSPGRTHATAADGQFCSLVLLLRAPATFTIDSLTAAAQNAFNHPFNLDDQFRTAAMPRPGYFAISTPDAMLGIIHVNQPYASDMPAAAAKVEDPGLKNALLTHTAWLSVDWIGALPPGGESRAYESISKMIAELLSDNVLAIYCTTTKRGHVSAPGDRDALRNGLILDLYHSIPEKIIVKTPEDDPELAAAAAEARRRWPDCVAAFNTPGTGDTFAVKKAFTDADAVEHMWVIIDTIDGDTIRGRLNSNPSTLRNINDGDAVTLSTSEIEDWLYTKGKNMFGGFQLKILSARQ